jgi:predicted protein tyrosine phosphatase
MTTITQIVAAPRQAIEALAKKSVTEQQEFCKLVGDYAIISITDTEKSRASLPESAKFTLRLAFHDIPDKYAGLTSGETVLTKLDDEQADKIAVFIKVIENRVNCLIAHCEAGVSRSTAIAIAVAEMLELKDIEEKLRVAHPHYNIAVYHTAMRAWEKSEKSRKGHKEA